MSDQPKTDGHSDISPETRLLILTRARNLNRELMARFSSIEQDLERGEHHAVLGALILADVQLQHMRGLLRVLHT